MKKWKKNLIAGALLCCVLGGIYVNWAYSDQETVMSLSDVLDEEKILSDMLVMGDGTSLENPENTGTAYFAAVRLSRQQARDSAVSLLQEAMSYSDETVAQETNKQLEEIVQTALCEAQIESLVIAKGYADCVAYMSETGISVAVASPEGGLKQEDASLISDIVLSQSSFTLEDIRVVEVK